MRRVVETTEWKRAVTIAPNEYPDRNQLSAMLAAQVREADVAVLVGICRRGAYDEVDTAMRVLLDVAMARDRRLKGERLKLWLRIARAVARKHYPRGMLGGITGRILFDLDPAGAERVVMRAAERRLPKQEARSVVGDLARLGTPRAARMLQVLAKGRTVLATLARHQLALRWGPTPQELGALASKWRKQGDVVSLQRLDSLWLPKMVGKPIKAVGRILGRPAIADDGSWLYRPRRPASAKAFTLTLVLDDEGRLEHHSLSC